MDTTENNTISPEATEFTCDICGEEFDTLSKLEEHKRRHGRPGLGLADEERRMSGDIGAAGLPTSPVQ
jgi:hypothetical protein